MKNPRVEQVLVDACIIMISRFGTHQTGAECGDQHGNYQCRSSGGGGHVSRQDVDARAYNAANAKANEVYGTECALRGMAKMKIVNALR